MSNPGQAVLTIGGTIIGAYLGGPAGALRGYAIGSALGAAAFPTQNKVEGPRLDDPKIPGTEPGRPIPWIQGRVRLAPDFLWKSAVRTIATTTTSGGKGGGPETEQTTYTYEVDLWFLLTDNLGLPDGETAGVTRAWYNKKLIWTNLSVAAQAALVGADAEDADFIARAEANLAASAASERWSRFTVYTGGADQLPDPTYETAVGADNAIAHRNRTSVFIQSFQLGSSPHLGLFEFEVCTKATGGQIDASVLLQCVFADDSADDISSFASPDTASNVSIAGEAMLVSGDESYVNWSGTHFSAPGGDPLDNPLTIEFFLTIGNLQAGVTIPILFFGINLGDDRRLIQFSQTEIGRKVRYQTINGGNQSFTGTNDFPNNVETHVALVIVNDDEATCEHRVYVNGVLEISVPNLPTSPNADSGWSVTLGTFGGHSSLTQSYSISGVRVKRGEVYTGASFTPPAGPEAWPDPLGDLTVLTPQDEDYDDVVSRVCQRGDALTTSQFDVTDLSGVTQQVRSFWMTQVAPLRPTLEMLGNMFHTSATLSDKLYLRRRAQAAVASIPFEDLGAHMAGSEVPEPLHFVLGSELELPAQIALQFADVQRDYQTDVQPSDRLLTAMESMQTISVPMGFTKSEGKQIADALAFDALAALATTTLHLDGRYAKLEPFDAVTVTDEDGEAHRLLLQDRTDTWPLLVFRARRDDTSVFDSDGTTDDSVSAEIDVTLPVDTVMELLDIPLLADAYDGPHLLVAAKGADSPWPGAGIMRSNDDVEYQRVATVTESAVIGVTTTALTDWSGPHVFDEMSSVTVNVGDGTLASSTRAAMLADRTVNAFALIKAGGACEIGQFRTATLVSTGVYKLTGLLRGLRGTEHEMTGHASGETFVLLTTSGLRRIDMQTNQLGASKYYRGVTLGRALSTATSESFTANGVSQKPFAPSSMKVLPQTNGDILLQCQLRSRLAVRGISTLGQSIPLGEESAAGEFDVLALGSPASVTRTLTGTITGDATGRTMSATYTAAQQAADGLALGSLIVRARQISATVGDGNELEKAA